MFSLNYFLAKKFTHLKYQSFSFSNEVVVVVNLTFQRSVDNVVNLLKEIPKENLQKKPVVVKLILFVDESDFVESLFVESRLKTLKEENKEIEMKKFDKTDFEALKKFVIGE